MATRYYARRILGVRDQAARMRQSFPAFRTRVEGAWLISVGEIQPTSLSALYRVEIRYKAGQRPDVEVLSPKLVCREGAAKIPHTFSRDRLCLYFPPANEWTGETSLGHSFIPWISLWLYYYELWHATGEWLGGGIEPVEKDIIKNERERIEPLHQ